MKKVFAVIGNPIEHSLSPTIHSYFSEQFNIPLLYSKILGDISGFEDQVTEFFAQGGSGLNITIPFKPRAYKMAQQCSHRCSIARAANTLWFEEGTLWADNTDGIGFIRDLRRMIQLENKKILVLGAGGAARGIIGPLLEEPIISLTITNRSVDTIKELQVMFKDLESLDWNNMKGEFDILINATAVSVTKDILKVPAQIMAQKPFCYDLAYNPVHDTGFVAYAKSLSCPATDGLGMLVEQAAESFYVWNGIMPRVEGLVEMLRKKSRSLL